VLELVAEGRSNQGIAKRLVITERAVQKHATNILKHGLAESSDDHRRGSRCSPSSTPSVRRAFRIAHRGGALCVPPDACWLHWRSPRARSSSSGQPL
jgi:hypothetical protein